MTILIQPMLKDNENISLFVILAGVVVLSLLIGQFVLLQGGASVYVVTAVFIFFILFLKSEFILYGLLLSMLLSPEITVGATAKREITVRFEDFIILVMTISWIVKTAITKNPGNIIYSPINRRVAFYLALCSLSTTFGMLGGQVEINAGLMFLMKYFEFYMVYIIVLNSIKNRTSLKYYTVTMLLVCFIVCITGFIYYFQGQGVEAPFEGKTTIEKNTLGGYLVLIFSFSLGIFIAIKEWKFRAPLLFFMLFTIGTLIISLSRSSWLALFGVILFYVMFEKRLRRALIIVLIISPGLLYLVAPEQARDRLSFTLNQGITQEKQIKLAGLKLDTSTSARLLSFGNALDQFYQHPILGWGITGFFFIDSQYFRTLAEIGLLGLLAFLFMIYGIWKMARDVLDKLKGFENGLVLGFMGGLVSLLVHSLGTNTFIIVRIMEPFWFLAALVTYLHIQEFNPEESDLPVSKPFYKFGQRL